MEKQHAKKLGFFILFYFFKSGNLATIVLELNFAAESLFLVLAGCRYLDFDKFKYQCQYPIQKAKKKKKSTNHLILKI